MFVTKHEQMEQEECQLLSIYLCFLSLSPNYIRINKVNGI